MKHSCLILILLFATHSLLAQTDDKNLSDFFGKKSKAEERSLLKSSFSKKSKNKERRFLSRPFSKKERSKRKEKNPFLPDFYARAVESLAERSQLPSFFNRALEKEKERTQQPEFFTKGIFKTKRTEPKDFFSKPVRAKKRGMQSDHFSTAASDKEHSEDDVTSGKVTKKRFSKRFIGERFSIFMRDPNKKARPKNGKKKKDPFGKKKRDQNKSQSPRNEMDLFQGGVLPKMKDIR